MCVANGDTGMQTGYESLARTEGYEIFERHNVEDIARTAAGRALAKLSARPAPSGEVPIVLAGGSGGILFHEACGHGLEADHIVKDASVYTGQVGAAGGQPAGHPGRRRHGRSASGATSPSTTRATRRPATCSSRTGS